MSPSSRRLNERCTWFGASSHAYHTWLRFNVANTALWNETGVAPDGRQDIQSDGRVWIGDQALEPTTAAWCCLALPSVRRNSSPITSSL